MKTKFVLLTLLVLSAAGVALNAADTPREIAITSNDSMQFNVREITARPGEALRVKFSNLGTFPKQAMGHNWVLLQPMTEAAFNAFAMACASKAPDYLPADRSVVLAHTKILGGGETDTIDLTAPAKPGAYPFLCTFPGHFSMMRGKLVVQ